MPQRENDMKLHHIYILGIILILASCTRHSQEWKILRDVETYIETHADSALVTLQGIRPENLANEEEKAKHALLHSMALDKNYIDLTNDSLINIAVDYYKDKDDVKSI